MVSILPAESAFYEGSKITVQLENDMTIIKSRKKEDFLAQFKDTGPVQK